MPLANSPRRSLSIALAMALAVVCLPASAEEVSLAASGGSYVSRDDAGATWAIGNARMRLVLEIDRTQGLRVRSLTDAATGRQWIGAAAADTSVIINGASVALGTPTGFRFVYAEASGDETGVELRLAFEHPTRRTRVVRHYVCYVETPVLEMFSEFQGNGGTATLSNLNAFKLTVPMGDVHWLTGLQTPEEQGGTFTLQHRRLASSQRLALGSEGRSSETAVPWFAVERDGERLFGGIMWSGAWSLSIQASASAQDVTAGLAEMTTTLSADAGFEGPHGFVGVAAGHPGVAAAAARQFVARAARKDRPYQPLITFNPWFAQGAQIDELTMRGEIENAARMGVELFVLDAGWYPGAASLDKYDYTSGLGRWVADPERFPSGLRPLRDYAHSLGLKFGIWVEPERVAMETVGEEGLAQEAWLARRNGRYDPDRPVEETASAQICLAQPDAWAWVLEKLVRLIDEVQPDYLKWDNNFWVNCTREGHTHGAADGNFAHVRGLYELLGTLRQLYPELVIENCAGGGNRLDFGIARYTDVAWMDDRTAPSFHVRHNLEGLTAAFPAAYLFSFVLAEEISGEPLGDVPLLFRSRMPGVLGIGAGGTPEEIEERAREVEIYRQVRTTQRDAATFLLTPQAGAADSAGWDALQQVSSSTGDAVLFAFQTSDLVEATVLRPEGLTPEFRYEVRSVDVGTIGEATGEELMAQGIEIVSSPRSAAHVLTFRVVTRPEPVPEAAARAGKKK